MDSRIFYSVITQEAFVKCVDIEEEEHVKAKAWRRISEGAADSTVCGPENAASVLWLGSCRPGEALGRCASASNKCSSAQLHSWVLECSHFSSKASAQLIWWCLQECVGEEKQCKPAGSPGCKPLCFLIFKIELKSISNNCDLNSTTTLSFQENTASQMEWSFFHPIL